jgi:hypothetical protein
MDNTKSTFDGQAFAKSNREKAKMATQNGGCPGIFGAVRWLGWFSKRMPSLSERARMVTILLVELSARNDEAFPSLRWLAMHMGCSTSSVRLAIREAEQSGLVRRGERFDDRDFSGGRQTSNRYEIVLHPGLELLEGLGLAEDRDLVIIDDEADPNQLELSVEDQPQAQPPAPPREAPRPALANVRPRVAAPVATAPQNESRRPPLLDSIAPPSQPEQGVKDLREKKEEKANSTRAREERTGGGPQSAAAFLGEVLPDEKARELKQRFGHNAFGGLLFAMRRNICREHPRLVKRALERLRVASEVANPGGYFFRVFQDELAAAELAGLPSAEDLRAEAERELREALQQRARRLKEQLEQVACVDFGAADRIRAELDQIYAQLRTPSAAKAAETSAPASRPPAPMPAPRVRPATATPAPLTPDLADAIAAAEEALAIVRGKGSATREPLPSPSRAA